MNREVHVRFREGVGVRFPRATRLVDLQTPLRVTTCRKKYSAFLNVSFFGSTVFCGLPAIDYDFGR
jgi:hypothetical protein